MVVDKDDVPDDVLEQVRPICLALPETYEEPAWIGKRWRIRGRTFAHVYLVEPGSPAALVRAFSPDVPTVVLTFRAPADEVDAIRAAGLPFFYAGWGRDVVGRVLDDDTDWDEVRELLAESFCLLAPKKLAEAVRSAS